MKLTMLCAALSLSAVAVWAVDRADTEFMHKAAQGGLAEVKMGQLAADKGSNQAVKDFGQQMVTDHSKANDDLKNVASGKGVTLPDTLDAKDQATYDRLSKLSGSAFDRAYINAMVRDHETDVTEFRKEASAAKDSDLKSFVGRTLPTLEHHLQMAKKAQREVGASSAKTR